MHSTLQATNCEFIKVGREASMVVAGAAVAYHKGWNLYGLGADYFNKPQGPATGPIGPNFSTRAEASLYASEVLCGHYHNYAG